MSPRPYRGVFTIPVTPFTDDGALDLPSLEKTVRYCIDAGAGVMSANAAIAERHQEQDDN